MKRAFWILCCIPGGLWAQEATSGFELRATITAGALYSHQLETAPRLGNALAGGFRAMLYPTWKLSKNWAVSGAMQVHSRPFFYEELSTQGNGVRGDLLQAHLSYSRFWKNGSIVFRAGQLSSAFGSFVLRYDDAVNPLIDMPLAYGYYYKPITTNGLAGAQIDVSHGRLDARVQFVNSSPANRRNVFDSEQYGNWTGGVGLTIVQGLRVGVSAYRGPYLHRQHRFFFPGEAAPRELPATACGVEAQWARGPWNAYGEWQRFQLDYRKIPTVRQYTGYGEARRVLHPRWYAAVRVGYLRANRFPGRDAFEVAMGFRPNRFQLVKIGYELQRGPAIQGSRGNTLALQLVTAFRPVSIARD